MVTQYAYSVCIEQAGGSPSPHDTASRRPRIVPGVGQDGRAGEGSGAAVPSGGTPPPTASLAAPDPSLPPGPPPPPPAPGPRGSRHSIVAVLAGIAIALLGLSGGLAVALVSDRDEDRERLAAPARTPTTAAGADGPLTDAELVERFGDAVWRVEVEGCGVTGTGSAFAIDEHHLVTNAHVVGVDPHPRLVSRDGEVAEPPPAAPVPCPTGAPSATVTEVVATRWDPELLPEWWDVTVRGQVTNGASADIDVWGVDVTVVGDGS